MTDIGRRLRRLRQLLRRCRQYLRRLKRRLHRLERRELAAARRWVEDTDNLLHLSVLLFVPATVAIVTALATSVPSLSFLLFPPLASGAYTLFSDPEGRYANSTRFVVGMTVGAVCGWLSLATLGDPGGGAVSAQAAGLAVFLTGALTWLLHVEEPASYAVALLLLVQEAPPGVYAASVAVASGIVALIYEGWHDGIYERRAELLYASTGTDDDILVPMVEGADPVTELAAQLASGYDGGKVVLLGIVQEVAGGTNAERDVEGGSSAGDSGTGAVAAVADDSAVDAHSTADDSGADAASTADDSTADAASAADDSGADGGPAADSDPRDEVGLSSPDQDAPPIAEILGDRPVTVDPLGPDDEADARDALVAQLEGRADELSAATDASVQVVVARGSDPAAITRETARETGSDLVLTPFGSGTDAFVTSLFGTDLDVAAARASRERWSQILVPIRSAGDLAHTKVDIARRLAGADGRVTVAHCIDSQDSRRDAEAMCANVVDPYDGRFETLVAQASIESFLADHSRDTDLVLLGASTDRTRVSRLLSRPTYERVTDLPTDLMVVHGGRRW